MIRAADQDCTRPWCDCRIVDNDHRVPHAHGGSTTGANSDGLCEGLHTTKDLPGWKVTCVEQTGGIPRAVQWRTPTGDSLPERHLQKLIGKHGHLRQ